MPIKDKAIIRGVPVKFDRPAPVITIGNFDGVHRGHQKVFHTLVEKARQVKGTPVAITFDPHPTAVLFPERGIKLITMPDDKMHLIRQAGIERIITIDFRRDFADTDADVFIKDILAGTLQAKWVVVGHDYSFGKGKKGTPDLLRLRGRTFGFRVTVVRYATKEGVVISSSKVRSLLHAGRVAEAGGILGRAYHIDGRVVHGTGRGSVLLHTPTANIVTENEIIPKDGVYAVRVSVGNALFDGVMNIGINPTFSGTVRSLEVHILDLSRELVGRKLLIHFIRRIREERKFARVQDLEACIRRDISLARKILTSNRIPLYS